MTKKGLMLRCKRCGGILVEQDHQFICEECSQNYPVREGVVLMEEQGAGVDLRIDDNLLDLHELRKEKKYYGSCIQSDVEYAARVHSLNFANFHAELLAPYMANSIVLDLGCGQLPYIEFFPDMKIKEFYGVDLSLESLKIARRNFKGVFPLILVRYGVKNIPFRDASVDMVVSSEVLEHLDDPAEYLKEIHRVMKDGGYLSLSTPCASAYLYPHNLPYIIKKPIDWYKKVNCHMFWKEALHWHPGLRPRILRKWMEEAGFSIIRHTTRLLYYHTPIRMMWRLFSIIEKIGIPYAGNIFSKYLKMTDRLLGSKIPIVNKVGIRQFVLCRK
jgi:SAM-dependent methyltransferase